MPPYEARRPAGSFRSSLRSNPRYDEREPLDDGDSGPGSDVTESEWKFPEFDRTHRVARAARQRMALELADATASDVLEESLSLIHI